MIQETLDFDLLHDLLFQSMLLYIGFVDNFHRTYKIRLIMPK